MSSMILSHLRCWELMKLSLNWSSLWTETQLFATIWLATSTILSLMLPLPDSHSILAHLSWQWLVRTYQQRWRICKTSFLLTLIASLMTQASLELA
jgi:hypothetical protein